MLSITSDFVTDKGCPGPYLKMIADEGFSHIHWCHQWNTDFLYSDCEIEQIEKWLKEYGLKLTDLHASVGPEKNWGSLIEYERQAGVLLVKNRLDMTACLGGAAIVMHLPPGIFIEQDKEKCWEQLFRSLDTLEPYAKERNIKIAVENGDFPSLNKVFTKYGKDFIGLCYDCGHGNLLPGETGIDELEKVKDRLIATHLHDNDGTKDQHKLIFSGSINWKRLAGVIASSAYKKWLNMEPSIRNTGITEPVIFLKEAFKTGNKFSKMVDELRK